MVACGIEAADKATHGLAVVTPLSPPRWPGGAGAHGRHGRTYYDQAAQFGASPPLAERAAIDAADDDGRGVTEAPCGRSSRWLGAASTARRRQTTRRMLVSSTMLLEVG